MKNGKNDQPRMATMGDADDSRTAPTVAPIPTTAAPWFATDDGRIIDGDGYVIEGEEGFVEDADRDFAAHAVNNHASLLAALKHAERFCPCGARPESPHTHPHVMGCPVELAIRKAEGR